MKTILRRSSVLVCLCVFLPYSGFVHAQRVEWETLSKEVTRLDNQGRYSQAFQVAEKALDVAARNFAENDVRVAASMSNL
jgi:hypothetical protein